MNCPLCGKENHCGIADDKSACWCMMEKFPEGIFEAVSKNEPQKCICQNCLHTYKNI